MSNRRILLVDDDPYLLNSFRRQLRGRFELETTESPEHAIELIRNSKPFSVIISDMQMPKMNGLELLQQCQLDSPRSIRVVLTGNADQQTAIDAINQGAIFRFLVKPCDTEALVETIEEAIDKYDADEAESQLLSETLNGAMTLVTDVLSTVRPEAFGQSLAASKLARELAESLELADPWLVELAAMLSYIGSITVTDELFHAYLADEPLRVQQLMEVERFAEVGRDFVINIPRLRPVANLIGSQLDAVAGNPPAGSRILRVVNDYLRFRSNGDRQYAIEKLTNRSAVYDQQVVKRFIAVLDKRMQIVSVRIADLQIGQTLAGPIKTNDGVTLMGIDSVVSEVAIERLKNFMAIERVDGDQSVPVVTEAQLDSHSSVDESDVTKRFSEPLARAA